MTIWIVVIGVAQVEDLADKTRNRSSPEWTIHNFTFTMESDVHYQSNF